MDYRRLGHADQTHPNERDESIKTLLIRRGIACFVVIFALIWIISASVRPSNDPVFPTESGATPLKQREKVGKQYGDVYRDKTYFDRILNPSSQQSVEMYCSTLNSHSLPANDREEAMGVARKLIEEYLKEHSASAMYPYNDKEGDNSIPIMERMSQKDQMLCQSDRSFVVGTYACPLQIGNRIHEFLNAFAGAIVTNRSLVWNYCNRDSCKLGGGVSRCDAMVQRKDWIVSADMMTQRLERGGCSQRNEYRPTLKRSKRSLAYSARVFVPREKKTSVRVVDQIVEPVIPNNRHSVDGEGLLACCGIDTLPQRFIDFGVLERHEMYGLVFPGSNLGPRAQSRAEALFGAGREFAYGLLFRSAFSFSEKLNKFNAQAITKMNEKEVSIKRELSAEPNHDEDDEVPEVKTNPRGPQKNRKVPPPPREKPSGPDKKNYPTEKVKHEPKIGLAAAGGKWAEPYAGNHTAKAIAMRKKAPWAASGNRNSDGNGIGGYNTDPQIVPPQLRGDEKRPRNDGVATVSSAGTDTDSGYDTSTTAIDGADFILAVHVRHMQARDGGDKDTRGELACIKQMLSLHVEGFDSMSTSTESKVVAEVLQVTRTYPCKVLLASDRHATLHRLSSEIEKLGCKVVIANHEEDYTDAEFKSYGRVQNRTVTKISGGRKEIRRHLISGKEMKSRVGESTKDRMVASKKRTPSKTSTSIRATTLFGEHGPWRDSFAAVADVHLLSHAHAFIGSADDRMISTDRPLFLSTYSMLIAELVRSGEAHLRRRHEVERKTGSKSEDGRWIRWLPNCGSAFGSYRLPKQPVVRSPEDPQVEIAYGTDTAQTMLKILRPERPSSTALHKISESGGNGHYEPSLCSTFTWGAKCYQMRNQRGGTTNGMSDICMEARNKNV